MVRRWRGRWADYGEPRVRRGPRSAACSLEVSRRGPRPPACSSSLEVSLWVAVFSLAGGDLLYAGGSGPFWGMLIMVVIGSAGISLVNLIRRGR